MMKSLLLAFQKNKYFEAVDQNFIITVVLRLAIISVNANKNVMHDRKTAIFLFI